MPEVLLWQALRRRQLDELPFRRQHPVGRYVLDFFCPAHGLAVEVDGMAHDGAARAARDERRDRWLAQQGIYTVSGGRTRHGTDSVWVAMSVAWWSSREAGP